MRIKKLLLALLIMIFFAEISSGQIMFQKTYQGTGTIDYAASVEQTTDGGYIIIGNDGSALGSDIFLLKSDSSGSILWSKNFGNSNCGGGALGNSVKQTTDGGFIITGQLCGFTVLIKTNSLGDTLWTQHYSYSGANSVQQTSDGGYILAGESNNGGYSIIKTNSNGDTLWTKRFIEGNMSNSVQQTTDGGYIIVGITTFFGAGIDDIYLVKTDIDGNLLWSKTFGGTGVDQGYSVQQTIDGGYIVAGRTNSFGVGGSDIYLIKTDSTGSLLWSRTFGGTSEEYGYSVRQTNDGGYIVAGYTGSFPYLNGGIYLIKTGVNGDTLWTKSYKGVYITDVGFGEVSVQQTSDGGFIIVGTTRTAIGNNYAIYLIKTDANGNSGCNQITPATVMETPATFSTNPATTVGSGIYYYPVIILLGSGSSTVTDLCTNGIDEITNDNSLLVFPNPANTLLNIHLTTFTPKESLLITDVLGREIYKRIINGVDNSIEVSHWSNGVYFYVVRNEMGEVRGKFVKE